jgi:hypothetical protein
MWKWTEWLVKTLAAGVIISFLSVWTTGYIVNSYVETLLKQYNIPLETKPFALNGVWGGLWGADPGAQPRGTASSGTGAKGGGTAAGDSLAEGRQGVESTGKGASESGAQSDDDKNTLPGGTDKAAEPNAAGDDSSDGKETPPVAVDAFGDLPDGSLTDIGGGSGTEARSGAASGQAGSSGASTGTSSGVEAYKDGIAMSTEQINAAKSQMTDADKQALFDVMMKKLPQDAWQKISAWMEDGLTNAEMTEVEQLIAQYLDRDEYDKMLQILKKY